MENKNQDQMDLDDGDEKDLYDQLRQDWTAMADKQAVTQQFIKESQIKVITSSQKHPSMLGFFNQKFDINRFFIEDSDSVKGASNGAAGGQEMPKIESSG